MPHFRSTPFYRIKHLKRWHQFIAPVDIYPETSITEPVDGFGQPVCTGAKAWKITRPRGNHFPLDGFHCIPGRTVRLFASLLFSTCSQ